MNSNQNNGLGIASLLLGYPTGGGVTWNITQAIGQPVYAIYAQDDWRVTHRLTLNLGLRWTWSADCANGITCWIVACV